MNYTKIRAEWEAELEQRHEEAKRTAYDEAMKELEIEVIK